MNDVIRANGANAFLCACDLNNRIRLKMYFVSDFAVTGEVLFVRPIKEGEKWTATIEYTYDAVLSKLNSPKYAFSFILTEGNSCEECMRKYDEEVKRIGDEYVDAHHFNPQIIIPKLKGEKWQSYGMYCYPV